MKKVILLSAVLAASLAFATDYNYEVTPVVGYNFAHNRTGLNNNELYGVEFQYNGFESAIKPELSLISSPDVGFDVADLNAKTGSTYGWAKSDIFRTTINGVYEYEKLGLFIPLVKAGLGYEHMGRTFSGENRNGMFVDAGVGAKFPLTEHIALKLEAIYMLKDNDTSWGNNLSILAGLNIAFGTKTNKETVVAAVSNDKKEVPKVVDGDDDKDGVLNSKDKCPNTEAGAKVDNAGCKIDGDDDKDGVLNSKDKCPNTEAGAKVDADGCVVVALAKVMETSAATAASVCPPKINLHINFKFDSAEIKEESFGRIDKFADFLKCTPDYNAKIVGYADNIGTVSYNQKLSERRANAVVKVLIEKGVNSDKLSAVGMGESNSIATNMYEAGRAENRRIEAEFTKK